MDSNNIKTRFLRLYETAQWSDCSFLVEDNEIYAHRLILATSSPVFEVMCYGPLAHHDTIHITDMKVFEFKQLLSFIYTDTVQFESIDNAWRLLYAAKKYLLTCLVQQCIDYITNNLCASSVLCSYELAEMFDEKLVQNVCLDMLKKYTIEVLNQDEYHMCSNTLNLILDQNTLNASEWDLICASICWCEDECELRNIDVTQKNCRVILEEIGAISKLRFMSLPVELLTKPILMKILTDKEIHTLQQIYKLNNTNDCSNNSVIPVIKDSSKVFEFDLNFDRRQRFRVALPFYTATRWILKGASILRINSANTTVKTSITSNRRVLVSSFTLPTRLVPRWITHTHHSNSGMNNNNDTNSKYLECFTVSIINSSTKTKVIPDTNFKHTVPNSSTIQVKLSEAVIFDCGVTYQIEIRWPFENFDLNGYEYSLDCLSTYAERKGTRFMCVSEYDLIQSISYSPYSM